MTNTNENTNMTKNTAPTFGRSEDGYVDSKDGRFSISPEFMGRTTAQAYSLSDNAKSENSQRHLNTIAEAKDVARSIVIVEEARGETVEMKKKVTVPTIERDPRLVELEAKTTRTGHETMELGALQAAHTDRLRAAISAAKES